MPYIVSGNIFPPTALARSLGLYLLSSVVGMHDWQFESMVSTPWAGVVGDLPVTRSLHVVMS